MANQGDRMQRRTFLKAAGVAGIVAAGRAPAFAQGTKLHIVRWVDFIPEADVELKRQAPEASKALGAEVTFEFINANDLQPRITAAIQSGSGADIIQMLWNWPQLYANALVDVSDVAEPIGKAQGGYYDVALGGRLALGRMGLSLDVGNLLDARANTFAFGNPFSLAHGTQSTPLRPRSASTTSRRRNCGRRR